MGNLQTSPTDEDNNTHQNLEGIQRIEHQVEERKTEGLMSGILGDWEGQSKGTAGSLVNKQWQQVRAVLQNKVRGPSELINLENKLFAVDQSIELQESNTRTLEGEETIEFRQEAVGGETIQIQSRESQSRPSRLRSHDVEYLDPQRSMQQLLIFHNRNSTAHTNSLYLGSKHVRIYVDTEIEFSVPIGSDNQLTCGWLLSEVTRRYLDALNTLKQRPNSNMNNVRGGAIKKLKRKMIVALKTSDQRESLDYWLTQYDRTLEVLEDGDFLIAHFAKMRDKMRENEVISKEDFEQIKVIGRGGFSRVVLARKKDTGRLYALKIMKKERIHKEKKLKPILSERYIMEKLRARHPFIIKLNWAFQSNDELFFVMDVCTGGELFYHLSCLKRLSETAAKFYFAEILLGLEHLHSLDIVYRDIKPENILLDVDGHVRIADFGLSKIIPLKQRAYSFCGSPEYMSPEMLACIGHDRRLDIYCLGALLFEMLTGLPPFYDRDTNVMYEKIMTLEVELPWDIPNRDTIGDLITRMMTKEPNQRYQSLAQVKQHPWLSDVRWDDILNKRIQPPILPNVRESHIDPDYTELPLDFEETGGTQAHRQKGRLSTQRRYSYYYESTLQSKKSLLIVGREGSGAQLQPLNEHKNQQSFFNHFFEKTDSVCSSTRGKDGPLPFAHQTSIKSLAEPSILTDNSQGSIDGLATVIAVGSSPPMPDQNKAVENFTFIDAPPEELQVLEQLQKHHAKRQVIKQSNILSREKQNMERFQLATAHLSGKGQRAANQQDQTEFIKEHQEQVVFMEPSASPPVVFHLEESDQNISSRNIPPGDQALIIHQTLSNQSMGTFFDESNQSIAQEFRANEEPIAMIAPSVRSAAILEISQSEGLCQYKDLAEKGSQEEVRLTIEEEEEDENENSYLERMGMMRYDQSQQQNKVAMMDSARAFNASSPVYQEQPSKRVVPPPAGMFFSVPHHGQNEYLMNGGGCGVSSSLQRSLPKATQIQPKKAMTFLKGPEPKSSSAILSPKLSLAFVDSGFSPSRLKQAIPSNYHQLEGILGGRNTLNPTHTTSNTLKLDSARKKQLSSFSSKLKIMSSTPSGAGIQTSSGCGPGKHSVSSSRKNGGIGNTTSSLNLPRGGRYKNDTSRVMSFPDNESQISGGNGMAGLVGECNSPLGGGINSSPQAVSGRESFTKEKTIQQHHQDQMMKQLELKLIKSAAVDEGSSEWGSSKSPPSKRNRGMLMSQTKRSTVAKQPDHSSRSTNFSQKQIPRLSTTKVQIPFTNNNTSNKHPLSLTGSQTRRTGTAVVNTQVNQQPSAVTMNKSLQHLLIPQYSSANRVKAQGSQPSSNIGLKSFLGTKPQESEMAAKDERAEGSDYQKEAFDHQSAAGKQQLSVFKLRSMDMTPSINGSKSLIAAATSQSHKPTTKIASMLFPAGSQFSKDQQLKKSNRQIQYATSTVSVIEDSIPKDSHVQAYQSCQANPVSAAQFTGIKVPNTRATAATLGLRGNHSNSSRKRDDSDGVRGSGIAGLFQTPKGSIFKIRQQQDSKTPSNLMIGINKASSGIAGKGAGGIYGLGSKHLVGEGSKGSRRSSRNTAIQIKKVHTAMTVVVGSNSEI